MKPSKNKLIDVNTQSVITPYLCLFYAFDMLIYVLLYFQIQLFTNKILSRLEQLTIVC